MSLNVVIFGAGKGGVQVKQSLPEDINIIAFVDNDKEKQGGLIDNILIIHPKKLFDMDYDFVLIGSMYKKEIKQQLDEMGIVTKFNAQELCKQTNPVELSPEFFADLYFSSLISNPDNNLIAKLTEISMLSQEVLYMLHYLSEISQGLVVELGSYIGGSTIAMASQLRDKNLPAMISVEPGGQHNHPTIPSHDIFNDLQANILKFGVTDYVKVINGYSYEQWVVDKVKKEAEVSGGLGLLVIDSNGDIEHDIERLSTIIRDNCILVIDDYISEGAPEKSILIKKWIDKQVASGLFSSLGVFPWGTWFGLYHR